jgi:hypothetical protein
MQFDNRNRFQFQGLFCRVVNPEGQSFEQPTMVEISFGQTIGKAQSQYASSRTFGGTNCSRRTS